MSETATFREIARLAEQITRDAAKWYRQHDVPEAFRGVDPMILARARLLSGGDWRRVTRDDKDNSLVVHNRPVWQPETA